jgi:hypothetical protein
VLLRLLMVRQLQPGGCGLVRGAYPLLEWAGNSWPGLQYLGWEATVKVYGVAVAMPQG